MPENNLEGYLSKRETPQSTTKYGEILQELGALKFGENGPIMSENELADIYLLTASKVADIETSPKFENISKKLDQEYEAYKKSEEELGNEAASKKDFFTAINEKANQNLVEIDMATHKDLKGFAEHYLGQAKESGSRIIPMSELRRMDELNKLQKEQGGLTPEDANEYKGLLEKANPDRKLEIKDGASLDPSGEAKKIADNLRDQGAGINGPYDGSSVAYNGQATSGDPSQDKSAGRVN